MTFSDIKGVCTGSHVGDAVADGSGSACPVSSYLLHLVEKYLQPGSSYMTVTELHYGCDVIESLTALSTRFTPPMKEDEEKSETQQGK